ncbi:hypothetical protein GGX14DRAFT_556452 [Mycena pura]|uniref:Uncharacterized protein n=1 Tax=Mycena pura TaxID=153505 RepID=A0AAD7E3I9_9AGAR|nr:hypothetical protein GGX14DRAFT_556452 [Mycena pura]
MSFGGTLIKPRGPFSRHFDRNEVVSFYLESECEVKKRTTGVPYADIMANTYDDIALRLGIEPTRIDSLLFGKSIAD